MSEKRTPRCVLVCRNTVCLCGNRNIGWVSPRVANNTLQYNVTGSSLGQDCNLVGCSTTYSSHLLLDIDAGLAAFYMAMADANSTRAQQLLGDTWNPDVAPCSGNTSVLGCDYCASYNRCGDINAATGRRFCKFRYVECNSSHRVSAIRLPYWGYELATLPDLGRMTALQVLDLAGSRVLSGSIPAAFGSLNITKFR
jgi:hypothetical protein